jgi:hypothetical protein
VNDVAHEQYPGMARFAAEVAGAADDETAHAVPDEQ